MADWATISSLATAAARTAERALQVGLRPVLFQGRPEDSGERIFWVDGFAAEVGRGRAVVEATPDAVYLAVQLRNAGRGIAVLHGWLPNPVWPVPDGPPGADDFRRLSRDLYVPAGDVGFWQGALRDPAEPVQAGLRSAINARERFVVDLLYGDHEGGQRTISRFALDPGEDGSWSCSVGRHGNLDRADPR